ncbi:hypothetical protein P9136_16030, partial [Bacillus cereus]|nr:hypothetical protein [Bacillus cereus]
LLPINQYNRIKSLLETNTSSFLFHKQLILDNPNEAYEKAPGLDLLFLGLFYFYIHSNILAQSLLKEQ